MMNVTEVLLKRTTDELKAIASEFELPRFKKKSKEELVNEVETLMKSKEFHNRVKEKLTLPMIQYLNLIFEAEGQCIDQGELKKELPDYAASEITYESLTKSLMSLGIIHLMDNKVCIPKETLIWLEEFQEATISEL